MKKNIWDKLDEMFKDAPMMRASSVSYDEINDSLTLFDFDLSDAYVEFVHRFGGATVGAFSVYGLRASETMGNDESSAFEVTKRFRDDGWTGTEEWLVISMDHSGNPIGLDREGIIWISDHDNGSVQKIAEDFEGFLWDWCLKV